MLEKTLESPLDSKEIKPVNCNGNQSWIFIRRADAEAEASIRWPPNGKNRLISKDPDAGKDWGQEEKRVTEDEMVGWHHQFNGHEFEQTLGDSEGQGSLACYSPWGCQKSDMTQRLNNNNNLQIFSPNLAIVFFALLIVSFVVQKLLSLSRSHLLIFGFTSITLGNDSKKIRCDLCQSVICLCFL